MFKKISFMIALQFTAFVFLLLLVNGLIFLGVDFHNAQRQTSDRLLRTADFVLAQYIPGRGIPIATISPTIRDRVRITDPMGVTLFEGGIFESVPFTGQEGLSDIRIQNDEYAVLTTKIIYQGTVAGYIQVADVERQQFRDLPGRVFLYLFVSVFISLLTFGVGRFFARRSLKPAEQMVTQLEQFTQDASHELRTPLAALNSSLDLALKTESYKEGIVSAKEDLQQILILVERLLEIARLEKFVIHTQKTDAAALMRESVERHTPLAAEKGITIRQDMEESYVIEADPALLMQVANNLLSNAIKYNRTDGTIDVTLRKGKLTVSDTGIGMPKEEIPRIFDRFYQADGSRSRGGFGLGLSLVKKIADVHGWALGVKSTQGKGTAFTILFSPSGRQKQP